jgi:hypothetical protein
MANFAPSFPSRYSSAMARPGSARRDHDTRPRKPLLWRARREIGLAGMALPHFASI